jgi:hypothetical protein
MGLREIGRVARLQIQRTSLKLGQKPDRVYDTSPLLSTQQLRVSPSGALAILAGGHTEIDVHHLDHPGSQNAGLNGVSVGFTPNYARMRERYGDHMTDGCAGENILVETAQAISLSDLERGLVIRSEAGEAWFGSICITRPCLEFSRYSLRLPLAERDSAEIKSALQFLDGGTRGFYVTPAGEAVISLGDRVYLPVEVDML